MNRRPGAILLPVAVAVSEIALRVAFVISAAAAGLACTQAVPAPTRSGFSAPPSPQPGGSAEAQPLFAQDPLEAGLEARLLEYALVIEPSARAALTAEPSRASSRTYAEAALTVAGVRLARVGLRLRTTDPAILDCFREGRPVCPKTALEIRLDAFDGGARLFGLSGIQLEGFADDASLMHQRLALELFRAMDLPAPRSAHARVSLNGQFLGLHLAVEPIDGPFVADRWPDRAGGNLYAGLWPGNGNPPFDWALRTNQRGADHTRFTAFNNLVRAARPAVLPGIVDEWLDFEHLGRYLALDEALNVWDGPRTFRCDGSGPSCTNRNFYWYQDPRADRLWLLPGDLTATFTRADPLWRVPRWTETHVDCNARVAAEDGTGTRAPACDRLLGVLARSQPAALSDARQRLLALWDPAALGQRLDRWATSIEATVGLDERGPSLASWRLGLQALKRDLEVGRAALAAGNERAAEGAETLTVFRNTFEGVDRATFLSRTRLSTNPRSGALHDLNRTDPLGGTQDVRIELALDNSMENGLPVPFSQSAQLRLPFHSGTSLREARRLRFACKSNTTRFVVVAIEGARAFREHAHPRLVASVEARVHATELTIELDDMKPDLPDLDEPTQQALRAAILAEPDTLSFQVLPVGLLSGLLPSGRPDVGFAQLDDIVVQ